MRHARRHLAPLLSALLGATACAVPAQLIHSPQVQIHRHDKAEDLSWLTPFADPGPKGRENDLARDPRFTALLRRHFTAPQSFWNNPRPEPLHEVALEFLGGPPGAVTLGGNRYFTADACITHFCPDRGLLWIDLGLPEPLFVFAAIDWVADNRVPTDKDATYTLWLFSSRPLDVARFPPALRGSIAQWSSQPLADNTTLENITRVFLIDPDGTPHPLSPATAGAHNTLPAETTDTTKVPS